MKISVDSSIMKDYMVNYDRDYFTMEALEAILDFYNEIDENIEFDPIAICCDWSEYGETPCLTYNDFLNDYSYLIEDNEYNEKEDKINDIINKLSEHTIVIRLSNSVLVMAF